MKRLHRRSSYGQWPARLLLATAIGFTLTSVSCRLSGDEPTSAPASTADPLSAPLDRLEKESKQPLSFAVSRGVAVAVTGRFPSAGADAPARARGFLEQHADLFTDAARPAELRLRRSGGRKGRFEYVVFYQVVGGIEVQGAELSVLVDGTDVVAAGGVISPRGATVSTRPRITAKEAEAVARTAGATGSVVGEPRLVIIDPALFRAAKRGQDPVRLVWRFAVGTEEFFVDAHAGEIVRRDDRVRAIDLQVYDAGLSGSPVRYDNGCLSAPCSNSVNAIVAAFEVVHAFYSTRFGWVGYNDDDADNEVYVRSFTTAYQSGLDELFHFNVGLEVTDVVGHEYTQGVNDYHSYLDGYYESGALSESLSDLMGNLVEGQLYPDAQVAETSTIGAVRNMCDPGAMLLDDFYLALLPPGTPAGLPLPDHYSELLDLPDTGEGDHGGIHLNAGIPNKAWCLTEKAFFELGLDKEEVRSRTAELGFLLVEGLPSDANFFVAASFAMANAQSLYGAIGDNPWGHACLIRQAWKDVGVVVHGPLDDECEDSQDDDQDGISNTADNCAGVSNASQSNWDGDTLGDACDPDADGDGLDAQHDNCVGWYNPGQEDADDDDKGDACEDGDHDGVDDVDDNCPSDVNPGQENQDGDDLGDACELDADGDGVDDNGDNCLFTANTGQANADGDDLGDACDPCPTGSDQVVAWTMGHPDAGIDPKPIVPDSDNDGIPDSCDTQAGGGSFALNGNSLSEAGIPVGGTGALTVSLEANTPAYVPFLPCPRDDCGVFAESRAVTVPIAGSKALQVAIVDDQGRVVARGKPGVGSLRLVPRGGRRYWLRFSSVEPGPVRIEIGAPTDRPEAPTRPSP